MPDNASVTVLVTVALEVEKDAPSTGEVTDKDGVVLSKLIVTLAVAVSPAVSVAVPLITCPAPSVETVCGLGQLAMLSPPAVHVNVTVAFMFVQPLAFAAGDAKAEIVGGETTVKGT